MVRSRIPLHKGNPFEFGRAIEASAIVDREEELKRLCDAMENGERLFLIGPRRFGKTSLLNAAQAALARKGVVVLQYDAEKFETTELLAQALLTGAVRVLAGAEERISSALLRQVKRFFGSLQPELSYDVAEQTWAVSILAAKRKTVSDLPLLTDVLDGIDAMAAARRRRAAVVLDEFQQLVASGGITAERQLRAVVQTHRHLSYVFAGSQTRLLTDMTRQHGRPFYRMGSSVFLGPVPRPAFRAFLQRGFEDRGFEVEEGAVERILDLAEDVPYSVQRLAHRCWDLIAATPERDRPPLSLPFIDRTLERMVLEEDPAYTQLWLSLTVVQKKALKAVIAREGRQLFSKSVADEYALPVASMQKAIKALTERGIVRSDQTLGEARLRLDDPFMVTWLRLVQSA